MRQTRCVCWNKELTAHIPRLQSESNKDHINTTNTTAVTHVEQQETE